MSQVQWPKATRIIRSQYPPTDLFEDIADPADWELILQGEMKTNPRVRQEVGRLDLVPVERRVAGPGASWVMAPFVHASPDRPTRFSAGHFGVYYCGETFAVALRETVHHFEHFMAQTEEPPAKADFRELVGSVDVRAHDLRGQDGFAACLHPDDYGPAQALGAELRAAGSDAIAFPSVRCEGGDALAALWPNVVGIPKQARHLLYRWNGQHCDAYFVYGTERWRPL